MPLTYLRGSQFGPVGFEIVNYPILSSRQHHPSNKQYNEHHVRECSSEVDNLCWGGKKERARIKLLREMVYFVAFYSV